jgi:hypothetical protein
VDQSRDSGVSEALERALTSEPPVPILSAGVSVPLPEARAGQASWIEGGNRQRTFSS